MIRKNRENKSKEGGGGGGESGNETGTTTKKEEKGRNKERGRGGVKEAMETLWQGVRKFGNRPIFQIRNDD